MGRHHEIRTGRSAGESVHPHVIVEHGVRDAPLERLRKSVGASLVPRLPQFFAPLPGTPICVIGGALRVVLCPFSVRHP